jgi:hypothetical protein
MSTAIDLPEILRLHKLWLDEAESGERADLRSADLSFANLSFANLSYVNLSYANLRSADLRSANLRFADLSYANLRSAEGFVLLPIGDPRGFSFVHAVLCGDEWRIRSGCRDFTIAEAREHWGGGYAGERWIGDMYLAAIDWLEKRLASGEVPS